MPKRKRSFKSHKKSFKRARRGKLMRRFRRRSVTRPVVSRSLGIGFPKRMVITHKYQEIQTVTSTAGVLQKYQWSVNSLYDPNTTGGGHQPMYFDQVAALYDHYVVIGSKIRITVIGNVSTTPGFFAGCYIDDDTTTSTVSDITRLAEQTQGRFITVAPSALAPKVFNMKWSAKKAFGGSILANTELQGTSASGPTEQQNYTLGLQAFAGTTANVQVAVLITYIAVWKELKEQDAS